ncbi:MAG: hypothetical protein CMG64_07615 [Candidatus Marinimicrobia bacterium]|nr:hypothetical protein [Candidatus Neomarinimicrobiota bacterium]
MEELIKSLEYIFKFRRKIRRYKEVNQYSYEIEKNWVSKHTRDDESIWKSANKDFFKRSVVL